MSNLTSLSKLKSIARFVFATLVCYFALLPIGCHSAENKAALLRQEQDVKFSHDVAELSTRYNAVTNWQQPLMNSSFSIEAEPIFLRSDHRPILFYATLEDVKRQQDAIAVYFKTTPTEGEPTLRLILVCKACDLRSLKRPAESFGDFAVIAEPTAVSKDSANADDAPDFVLNGNFIEAQFIGDYALDKATKAK